mmetsp:Transcript_4285/g.12365  ORF Transcript_4285/g.12365 Transcript_4285/m.12365 type:complete len:83 (-) Transcript_4285:143-391(-)
MPVHRSAQVLRHALARDVANCEGMLRNGMPLLCCPSIPLHGARIVFGDAACPPPTPTSQCELRVGVPGIGGALHPLSGFGKL